MLTSVDAAFERYLNNAIDYFTGEKCAAQDRLPKEEIEIIFGSKAISPGVYFSGLNTGNFALKEVIDTERDRYRVPDWIYKTTYGIADDPDQAVAFVKKEGMPCPCTMTMFPVSRDTPYGDFAWDKFGPEIGERSGEVAYVWHLYPLDPIKLSEVFGIEANETVAPAP